MCFPNSNLREARDKQRNYSFNFVQFNNVDRQITQDSTSTSYRDDPSFQRSVHDIKIAKAQHQNLDRFVNRYQRVFMRVLSVLSVSASVFVVSCLVSVLSVGSAVCCASVCACVCPCL